MIEMDDIAAQVQRNCTISDSRYAGNYSVCGLALRLRDLYKWEKGLEPWVEEESSVLLEWIGRKEEEWETLTGADLAEITIQGTRYPPFDLEEINALLEPRGFYYGAGFVHGLKPTFFLAHLENTREEEDGVTVLFLGRELARDLLTLPAMTQNDCILVRKESARLFLWNQVFFVKNSGRDALQFALKAYGITDHDPASLQRNLNRISDDELETYVHHEMGEIREGSFDRSVWRELLSVFPHTPVEIVVRTLKDILAETGKFGSISHIIRQKKASSLGLYAAFLDGLKKEMFSELPPAFKAFTKAGDWSLIEEAASSAYQRAKEHADRVTRIFQEGKKTGDLKRTRQEIAEQVLRPLGFARET
jgi:hypothetical protein